jgi:hypothetical protein
MIAQFLIDCGLEKQENINELREKILKHLEYGTLTTLYDDKGLYAVARYNLEDNGIAFIIDVGIRKDKRYSFALKELVRESWLRYPNYKYLKFERGLKDKRVRLIPISRFLKEK